MLKPSSLQYIKDQFITESQVSFMIQNCEIFCEDIRNKIRKQNPTKAELGLIIDLALKQFQQLVDELPKGNVKDDMLKIHEALNVVTTNEFLGD